MNINTAGGHITERQGISDSIGYLEKSQLSQKLFNVAQQGSKEFQEVMKPIFGHEIPDHAYENFRRDILDGKVSDAPIEIGYAGLGPAAAAYDQSEGRILLSPDLAFQHHLNDQGQLQRAIAEETGHHFDFLLRNHYSQIGGDAKADEGALFARDFGGLPVSDHEIQIDGKNGALEFFEAKEHREIVFATVERVWKNLLSPERKEIQNEIYFGNWLRDMSNAYDPAGVEKVAKMVTPHVQDDPEWLRSLGFSDITEVNTVQVEQALTEDLLGVLAEGISIEAKARFGQDITAKDIGTYFWKEHIDNPYQSVKEQMNNVDPHSGVSKHLLGSRDRIAGVLQQAFGAGFTPEGRKLLGNASHTLEDLFAHSNYIEIGINTILADKGKEASIETWVSTVNVQGQSRPLLTTGGFGDTDIGYSLAPGLASALFPQQQPGHKDGVFQDSWNAWKGLAGYGQSTDRPTLKHADKILEILAQQNNIDINGAIDFKNNLSKALAPIKLLVPDAVHHIENLINQGGSLLINGGAESIPIQQSMNFNADTTLPSHSQLAKDHTDHHFHDLAKQLGQAASKDIMFSMKEAWDLQAEGDGQGAQSALNQAIEKVNGYFTHPDEQSNEQITAIMSHWVADAKNADAITRGQFLSGLHQAVAGLSGMDEKLANAFLASVAKGEPDRDIINLVQKNMIESAKGQLQTVEETMQDALQWLRGF